MSLALAIFNQLEKLAWGLPIRANWVVDEDEDENYDYDYDYDYDDNVDDDDNDNKWYLSIEGRNFLFSSLQAKLRRETKYGSFCSRRQGNFQGKIYREGSSRDSTSRAL
ncbi:hypothetical protein HZH68_006171 [Vespula germanica]|uniref:Uncharacterized protein n=1 Tax=Vespula germanica TaxID=30212 RepID=A0A834KCE1_VESGE|nr:hypothetical protein HZH68_006171 [Vespula germanica]